MDIVLTATLLGVVALLLYKLSESRLRKFPPGPWGYPLVGNLLALLSSRPYEIMCVWAERYGPITGVKLGQHRAVILNDWLVVREALVKQGNNFAGRYNNEFINQFCKDGLIQAEGAPWKEQRRFFLAAMRDFGFGTRGMESYIRDGAKELVNKIDGVIGKTTDTNKFFNMPVINVLWSIVAGGNFEKRLTEAECEDMLKIMKAGQEAYGQLFFLSFTPVLGKIYDLLGLIKKPMECLTRAHDKCTEFMMGFLVEHKLTYKPEIVRDFFDLYLKEIKERQELNPNTTFTEGQLLAVVADVFHAGIETSSESLRWAMAYMSKYKHVQGKVQEELDRVLGHRTVTMDDKQLLIYTEATILELHRHVTMVPLAAFHRNFEEAHLCGYTIPKSTIIVPNLYRIHHDPALWEEPEQFNPERFIQNGNIEKPEYFMPFSCGKRACPGEPLARYELLLFFVTIMQNYSVEYPPGVQEPDLAESSFVGVRYPPDHFIIFKKRNAN